MDYLTQTFSLLLKDKQAAYQLTEYLCANNKDPIAAIRQISYWELSQITGEEEATRIMAALELGKTIYLTPPQLRTEINSPDAAARIFSQELMHSALEKFAIAFLDGKNQLLGMKILSVGTATETLVDPKLLFREMVRAGCTRAIVAHNHPTGEMAPSIEDLNLTEQLLQGGQLLNLAILDHLILGGGCHRSLAQTTQLWEKYPQGN